MQGSDTSRLACFESALLQCFLAAVSTFSFTSTLPFVHLACLKFFFFGGGWKEILVEHWGFQGFLVLGYITVLVWFAKGQFMFYTVAMGLPKKVQPCGTFGQWINIKPNMKKTTKRRKQ